MKPLGLQPPGTHFTESKAFAGPRKINGYFDFSK
jgi:hypothetical protein